MGLDVESRSSLKIQVYINLFRDTLFTPWKVNGKNAGFYKTVGYL
jgi:hypothetical protein